MNHDGLRTFGARVIYCEARSQLQPEVRLTMERELTDRLVVETRYGFTIEQAIASIGEMAGTTEDPTGILGVPNPPYRTPEEGARLQGRAAAGQRVEPTSDG